MLWALDLDDFTGHCSAGRYPLLRAVNVALGLQVANQTQTLGRTMISRPPPSVGRPLRPVVPPSRRRHKPPSHHRPSASGRLTTSLPILPSSTPHQHHHHQQQQQQPETEHHHESTVVVAPTPSPVTSKTTPTAQGLCDYYTLLPTGQLSLAIPL